MTFLPVVNFNVKMSLALFSLLSIDYKFSYKTIRIIFIDLSISHSNPVIQPNSLRVN